MSLKYYIIFLFCSTLIKGYSQEEKKSDNKHNTVDIGDVAPQLYLQEWLKGAPIRQFEKGHIYVLEFWATWCKPCIAAMPHLSKLAVKYKGRVSILGVNIYEEKNTSLDKIKAFVDSQGDRMNYKVARDDRNQMVDKWIVACGEKQNGIPRSFIVNTEGVLAWIGHPNDLDTVLRKVVDNSWDINKARENKIEEGLLKDMEEEANSHLNIYKYEPYTPDSLLNEINKIIQRAPGLENTFTIYYHTFLALLRSDQRKALEYGKRIFSTNKKSTYTPIIYAINYTTDPDYPPMLHTIPEIYHLGAEAYQVQINSLASSKTVDISKYYANMANWYWKANEPLKAIEAQEKAIKSFNTKKMILFLI